MLTCCLEEHIDAYEGDILEFLERAVQCIHPTRSDDSAICFCGYRNGKAVSIHVKSCESEQTLEEVIRFDVIRRVKGSSVVRASCQSDNSHIILVFHRIWTSLAIAFGASFAGRALKKLHELEYSGAE